MLRNAEQKRSIKVNAMQGFCEVKRGERDFVVLKELRRRTPEDRLCGIDVVEATMVISQ